MAAIDVLPDQTQLEDEIAAEQLRMLYDQAPASFTLEIILASFVAYSVSSALEASLAFWWWVVIVAFAVADFIGYIAFKSQAGSSQRNYKPWYALFLMSVAVMSCAWGVGMLFLMMKLELGYQLFLTVILAAIAGGALPAISMRRMPLMLFLIGSLSPAAVWLMSQEHSVQTMTGAFLIPYGIALWFGGRQISLHIRHTLQLSFENRQLADSLRNSNARLQELNQDLTHLSATDALTQVANRRYFEERLEQEWRRIVREEGEVAVVMVDIDHFKAYNDSLGHQAGDECLCKVAACVRDSLRRPADIVARYGGEEFIVLLPNTNPEGARRVADMIRDNVRKLEILHPASATSKYITVSVGGSYCQPTEATLRKQLIAKADTALYAAKEAGRNQVCFTPLD